MSKVKTQHYVPRFLLRQFTEEFYSSQEADPSLEHYAAEDGHLYVFSKADGGRFRSNVTNIAAETYFYDLPDDKEQLLIIAQRAKGAAPASRRRRLPTLTHDDLDEWQGQHLQPPMQ